MAGIRFGTVVDFSSPTHRSRKATIGNESMTTTRENAKKMLGAGGQGSDFGFQHVCQTQHERRHAIMHVLVKDSLEIMTNTSPLHKGRMQ